MNIIIGITGPTGSGKSVLSKYCNKFGFRHINCDTLAREAVQKHSEGLLALTMSFGNDILNNDGSLNRKRLAAKAFCSKENTELLNKTILPFIKKLVLKETNKGKILLDAPTLFESGINKICFKTIAVLSDKNIRLERIIARDNLAEEDALLRINAGKSDNFYKENADYIIYNNKTETEFFIKFNKVLNEILQQGENL